jgi:transposase InsO family protein
VLCGIPAATVHRVIRRQGLERQRAARPPVIRYEFDSPGAMLHCDTKKLGRIVDGPGHRIHGDHSLEHKGVGWEVLHMAIDDCGRLVYAEMLGDEKGRTAAHFLIRALRWFRTQGIRVDRLLTDNGAPYRSKAWRRVCRAAHLRHRFTGPYHPQTNGKAERWIRPSSASASTLRFSRAPSTAGTALLASSSGTTNTVLTVLWEDSVRALVPLSCRRRECYQPREPLHLETLWSS